MNMVTKKTEVDCGVEQCVNNMCQENIPNNVTPAALAVDTRQNKSIFS